MFAQMHSESLHVAIHYLASAREIPGGIATNSEAGVMIAGLAEQVGA